MRRTTVLDRARIEDGYAAWAERLLAEGWTPHLLSFMIEPIGGSAAAVDAAMVAEVVRVYATHVTRVVRCPARAASLGRHPVWLCALDRPVYKHARVGRLAALPNNGRHVHAVAFVPPVSRLRKDLGTHFEGHSALYAPLACALDRIDVEPITHDVGYVTRYIRKWVARWPTGEDACFVLPRALSEMP